MKLIYLDVLGAFSHFATFNNATFYDWTNILSRDDKLKRTKRDTLTLTLTVVFLIYLADIVVAQEKREGGTTDLDSD